MRKYLYGKWLEDEVIDTPPQAPVQSIKRTSHPLKIVYSSGSSVMFDGSHPVEVHLPSVDDVQKVVQDTEELKTKFNELQTNVNTLDSKYDTIINSLNDGKSNFETLTFENWANYEGGTDGE